MGKILIIVGLLTVLVGLVMQFTPQVYGLGNYPGISDMKKEILNSFSGNHDDSLSVGDSSFLRLFGK